MTDLYRPTPTQVENDAAAKGEHVMNKEPDGSPEEATPANPIEPVPPIDRPVPEAAKTEKTIEAAPASGSYKTRHMARSEVTKSDE